jgi:tRNA 2-selenouridine synthase
MAQPCQKRFDTLIWNALRTMDPDKAVFVESESKKVGNVSLPNSLVETMRQSPCLNLHLPDAERVALLMEDYDHLVRDVDFLCDRLAVLVPLRGRVVVEGWMALARSGKLSQVVQDLLTQHYDPTYLQSMQRNFIQFNDSKLIAPDDHSAKAMADLSGHILRDL